MKIEQSFSIPGRLAGSNEVIAANRSGPYVGAKLVEQNITRCRWAIRKAALTPMRAPVTVEIRFFEPNRRRDPGNVFYGDKFILDALQREGILGNDNQKWLKGPEPIRKLLYIDQADPRVEVTLREVD